VNESTKQIVTAIAAASAAALVTGFITHYWTQKATVAAVSNGTTPLLEGASPTFQKTAPQGSTPNPTTADAEKQNTPVQQNLPTPTLQQMAESLQTFIPPVVHW
jgi:hypothetical protein